MSLKIRLARAGAKKRPFYRIVVADARNPRDGSFKELIGTYNPLADPPEINFKKDRLDYWLGKGAKPTTTLSKLFKTASREA